MDILSPVDEAECPVHVYPKFMLILDVQPEISFKAPALVDFTLHIFVVSKGSCTVREMDYCVNINANGKSFVVIESDHLENDKLQL